MLPFPLVRSTPKLQITLIRLQRPQKLLLVQQSLAPQLRLRPDLPPLEFHWELSVLLLS